MKIRSVGNALSLFFVITFIICIGWGLLTPPTLHMHGAWEGFLPGFEFLTPLGFGLGLIESYLYGWYIALVFVPLYNRINTAT